MQVSSDPDSVPSAGSLLRGEGGRSWERRNEPGQFFETRCKKVVQGSNRDVSFAIQADRFRRRPQSLREEFFKALFAVPYLDDSVTEIGRSRQVKKDAGRGPVLHAHFVENSP